MAQVSKAKLEDFVRRWENLEAEAGSIMGKAKAEVKGCREGQWELLEEAEAAGVDKRALKAAIKSKVLAKKIDDLRERLEPESQDALDQIKAKLGWLADTPLGEAALMTAKKGRRHGTSSPPAAPGGELPSPTPSDQIASS